MERHKVKRLSALLAALPFLMQSCTNDSHADLCESVFWTKEQIKEDEADKIVTMRTVEAIAAKSGFTGIVTDPDGNQLSGASVQLTYPGLSGASPIDTTNIAGRFSFARRHLPAGVSVRIDKKGYRCLLAGDIPVKKGTEMVLRLKVVE